MSSYTTRYLTKDEYKEWDELVLQSPTYNIFDTTLWLDTLSSVLKCDINILGVFKEQNLVGGVAFNVIKRFGIKIANIPPMNAYNSLHYISRETQYKGKNERYIENIIALIADRLQKEFNHAVITNHPDFKDIRGFKTKDWRQNVLYSYQVYLNKVDLSLISAAKRRQVKKARKNLIVTEEIKDIAPVYDIIEQTYIRQNLKCPLTLDEISGICTRMGGHNVAIRAAREQNSEKYKAVIVYVIDHRKKCVYNLLNAYTHESPDSGANSLLMWEGIEYLKDRGFEFFDFGEASIPSKAFFKSEFSADLIPYCQVSKSNLLFKFLWYFTKGRIMQQNQQIWKKYLL